MTAPEHTPKPRILRHILIDGTHEIRLGLLLLAAAGGWLSSRAGVLGDRLILAMAAAALLLLAAGPGVTRLRTQVVIPRLGYARPHVGLPTIIAFVLGVAIPVAGLGQLAAMDMMPWGASAANFVIAFACAVIAVRTGLARHIGLAACLVATAAILAMGKLTPWDTIAAQGVAFGLLLVTGGAAGLSALITQFPEPPAGDADDR